MRSRLIASLLLAGALLFPVAVAAAEPTIVFVTRHGEKASPGKDPELTPQGQARARTIATILRKADIRNVFSTATVRTQQTAQPTAAQARLPVHTYDPAKPMDVVDKIKALGGNTLLVGHSNTVPDLVKKLGGTAADMTEEEFDRLYQIIIAPDGSVTTVLLTSVAAQ
jgi:phosphohistidine phosphatase SixA